MLFLITPMSMTMAIYVLLSGFSRHIPFFPFLLPEVCGTHLVPFPSLMPYHMLITLSHSRQIKRGKFDGQNVMYSTYSNPIPPLFCINKLLTCLVQLHTLFLINYQQENKSADPNKFMFTYVQDNYIYIYIYEAYQSVCKHQLFMYEL